MDPTTSTTTTTSTPTTTTPASKEEVVEHVEAEVIYPGYDLTGTAPTVLLDLIEGGFNPLFLI